MIVAIPILFYFLILIAVAAIIFVVIIVGYFSLLIKAFFTRSDDDKPLPPPPFEPYMVYIPKECCGGCGMPFAEDSEHFCRWCGTQREYQEIEIAYKGNLKRLYR